MSIETEEIGKLNDMMSMHALFWLWNGRSNRTLPVAKVIV